MLLEMPEYWLDGVLFFVLLAFAVEIKQFVVNHVLFYRYFQRKNRQRDWQLPMLAQAGLHGLFLTLLLFPLYGTLAPLLGLLDALAHLVIYLVARQVSRERNPFTQAYWMSRMFEGLVERMSSFCIAVVGFVLIA